MARGERIRAHCGGKNGGLAARHGRKRAAAVPNLHFAFIHDKPVKTRRACLFKRVPVLKNKLAYAKMRRLGAEPLDARAILPHDWLRRTNLAHEGVAAQPVKINHAERIVNMQFARRAVRVFSPLRVIPAIPIPQAIRFAAPLRRDFLRLDQRHARADGVNRPGLNHEEIAGMHFDEIQQARHVVFPLDGLAQRRPRHAFAQAEIQAAARLGFENIPAFRLAGFVRFQPGILIGRMHLHRQMIRRVNQFD